MIQIIDIELLVPFENHPFKERSGIEQQELTESIKENGLLEPIIARPFPAGKYEIISGHRRVEACKALGITSIPVTIKELTKDEAIVQMVDSNIHREQKRLISEVEENEKSLIELQKQTVDMKMLYQGLMEFTEMKQLTPTVVNKLIERIEIHNNEKKHSHNNVKVDIYFTAVGLFDIPTEQQLIDTMERVKQKNAEKSA